MTLTEIHFYYPRDAVLSPLLAVALCLFVSVTSRCSVKRNEWINLVFGMEVFRLVLHLV